MREKKIIPVAVAILVPMTNGCIVVVVVVAVGCEATVVVTVVCNCCCSGSELPTDVISHCAPPAVCTIRPMPPINDCIDWKRFTPGELD